MSFKKMPPQAYTKETLQEAFEWWSEQPEDFRAKVQDKDDLVGYYLKVRRRGESASENLSTDFTEVAKESFSIELKDLAKNLDAFEGYRNQEKKQSFEFEAKDSVSPSPEQVSTPAPKPATANLEPAFQLQFPDMSKKLVATSEQKESSGALKPQKAVKSLVETKTHTTNETKFFKLDAKSRKTVREVKEQLNLSSEEEALRAIIALGSKKFKALF